VRHFAGAPGILDGLNPIPDVCVRTGRQQPGQVIQDIRRVFNSFATCSARRRSGISFAAQVANAASIKLSVIF
jgi:hypothetical protein